MDKNYALVQELKEILAKDISKEVQDDVFLEAIEWFRTKCFKKPGVTKATEHLNYWIYCNYGFDNHKKLNRYYRQKYPLHFEDFSFVQKDSNGHNPKKVYYTGFHRIYEYGYPLKSVLKLIPEYIELIYTKDDILNRYGQGTEKVKEAILEVEKEFELQTKKYKEFFQETGLPVRFYGGEFKGSLLDFIEKKDPTEYIEYSGHFISIDKGETCTTSYISYQDGVVKLFSSDRKILIGYKGNSIEYPLKSFSKDFFLKFLNTYFKKKIKFHKVVIDANIEGELFERKWDTFVYDYGYELNNKIKFNTDPFEAIKETFLEVKKDWASKLIFNNETLLILFNQMGYPVPKLILNSFYELNNLEDNKDYTYEKLREILVNKFSENCNKFLPLCRLLFIGAKKLI